MNKRNLSDLINYYRVLVANHPKTRTLFNIVFLITISIFGGMQGFEQNNILSKIL